MNFHWSAQNKSKTSFKSETALTRIDESATIMIRPHTLDPTLIRTVFWRSWYLQTLYTGQHVRVTECDYVNTYLHSMVGKWKDGIIATLKHLIDKLDSTMLKTLEIRLGKLNKPPVSLSFQVKSV